MHPPMPKSPCADALSTAHRQASAVTRANANWDQIQAVADANSIDPAVLAAVGIYETNFQPGTIGDHGHGHGLFQMDDRWNSAAVIDMANMEGSYSPALDFTMNLAAQRISSATDIFQNHGYSLAYATAGALRAYNAGPGGLTPTLMATGYPGYLDVGTANQNYVSNVLAIAINCF
jgi:hypothetical protein